VGQGKQAKILTEAQIAKVLNKLGKRSRYAIRDRAMFLLSIKAGLRAKEIANLKWSMLTDAEGNLLDVMALPNKVSKGAGGGRSIPMNRDLRTALVELAASIDEDRQGDDPVIASERGGPMNAGAVTMWFWRVYRGLGFKGASSHSGRRTFITRAAKKVVEAGGSLRDVQQLAGHSSLSTTQRYIEGDSEAKRKLVDLI
jgi:integrase/recombinase XerD